MPTRKDKTNVAPAYREQVFIPASGTTLMKQKARPKAAGRPVSSGAIEIVSPEFDLLTGARGLFNMIKPNKVYANIGNGSNMTMFDGATTTNEAVKQGIKEARDYVRHPVIVETVERNKELAERISGKPARNMGWFTDGNKVSANTRAEVLQHYIDRPVHIQTSNDLPKGFLGDYTSANTRIRVKSGLSPYDTKRVTFHEGLHHSGYGNFEGGLYDLKAEKLFGIDDYLLGHEAAVNTAELGRMMGLELGQKYPGLQTFKDMITKYNVDGFDKKFIFDKAILNTPRDYKRFWDALTGKYFTTAGAAATGLNLTNTDKMKCGGRRKAQLGLDIREGGIAIPIANNMFYIDGRKHTAGGVAIGPNNKNGVEVEGGEVVEMIDSNHPSVGRQFKAGGQQQTMRVFSSVPLLRGVSPAQLVLGGANPDAVFKAQEEFKDRNRINDDGTTYEVGGEKIYTPSKSIQRQIQETGKITIGGAPTIGGLRTFGYLRGLANARKYGAKGSLLFRAGKELIKRGTQKLVDNGKITKEVAQIPRSIYGQFVGAYGQNLPKTIGLINNMEQKRFGGSKQDDTKTAALKHLRNKFTIRGNYNGGMFGGAGAGSVIMTQPEYVTDTITKRYLVPVTQNFNDAFGDAVDAGLDKFMFDNKWYNTKKSNNPNNNSAGAARTQTVYLPVEHKEVRRRKKEYGGSMIYTINGNVKNGLSLRPKAKYGKIDRKNKDEKVGPDGLIYKRAADGEWYTDGTVHAAFKKANPNGLTKPNLNKAKKFNYTAPEPKRVYIDHSDYEEEKETKKVGSLTYEKNESGKWVPSAKQSTTTTRDGGKPKDFGMTRTGVNHPNGNYKYHPLTGEKISEMGVVEASEPSVKGTTKVNSKPSSTARGRGTTTASSVSSRGTAKVESPKPATATNPMEARYASRVQKGQAQEVTPKPVVEYNEAADKNPDKYRYTRSTGFKAGKSPSSTGSGTQSKESPWIPQYNTITGRDWFGVGTNLAGHIASYFANNSLLKKAPMPTKPVSLQAAKLKTTHNINPELANINEVTQMNLAEVGRNTSSSSTSLARKQRIMNEARDARNKLYGQKENVETQLINLDRRNRQDVYNRNVAAYNDWLDKTYAAKSNNLLNKQRNLTNLISGIPMAVNTMLGTIETRKSTNDMIRAIVAASPNVDGRLLGIGDYFTQKQSNGRTAVYNKNHKLVKYV